MAYIPTKNTSVSGTVGASIIGLPYFGVAGSVATVGTAVANQSVSGQVETVIVGGSITTVGGSTGNSSVQLLGIPSISGTVRVVQQTDPWKIDLDKIAGASAAVSGGTEATALRVTIASDSTGPGSVAARQLGTRVGSVQLIGTPSISGAVTIVGSSSITALQGTNPWVVNQPSGSIIATQIAGSIMNVNVSGSVATVGTAAANQSVSGSVGITGTPSISGAVTIVGSSSITALQGTNPWLVGNSSVQIMGIQPAHSVAVLQGTNPWVVNQPSGSIIATQIAGSVMNVNISGSVATVGTAAANQSVSGSVGIVGTPSISGAVTIVGSSSITALQGTNPWQVNVPTPSYVAYQLAGSVMATSATVTMSPTSVMLIGSTNTSIACAPSGAWRSSVQVLNGVASVYLQAGSAAIGSVATLQGTSPWLITGSVMNAMTRGVASVYLMPGVSAIGSVATLQGTTPWIITGNNNSVISADSYAEDAAHATGNRGTFVMGVRNDTLASITTTDGDYSPFTVGPSGEQIVANAPITKWISATTSVMAGPSVLLFAAPGASVFNYVSGYHITNPGTVAAHVAFSEGLGAVPASIMFFGIAPAGGGSNVVFRNPIKTTLANKNISASVSAHSSVYITMEGFTVKQLT